MSIKVRITKETTTDVIEAHRRRDRWDFRKGNDPENQQVVVVKKIGKMISTDVIDEFEV